MVVFPVLIPGQNFLFPGMGREIIKCHGKGREGKFEACIPRNHGKREFPGFWGRVYRGFAGVVGVCGGVQCSCQMRKEGSTAAVARRRSHRPLTPLTQTLSKTAQCTSASSFFISILISWSLAQKHTHTLHSLLMWFCLKVRLRSFVCMKMRNSWPWWVGFSDQVTRPQVPLLSIPVYRQWHGPCVHCLCFCHRLFVGQAMSPHYADHNSLWVLVFQQ